MRKKLKPKTILIGINFQNLTSDFIQRLGELMEEEIRRYILKRIGRRLDNFDIIVKIEASDMLRISVDVGVVGRGRFEYDILLDEAIKEAYSKVEEVLRNEASIQSRRTKEDDISEQKHSDSNS